MSDLEGEEGEEDVGTSMPEGEIPQIPDQEKFLKEHFGTLSNTDGKGTSLCSVGRLGKVTPDFFPYINQSRLQVLLGFRSCVCMGRGGKRKTV